MSKISRRKVAVASAAISLAAASTGASASNAASAPSLDLSAGSNAASAGGSLSTVFSCGSRWTTAKTCATLCPTGDDDACPPGQYCYGGMPCEASAEGEGALERQHRLERREMDRLARSRDEEYVDRFVCGRNYDDAAASCAGGASSPPLDGGGDETAFYCPAGSSAQCPVGTRCYAAVSCPRATHDEEPPMGWEDASSGVLPWSLATEPLLLNATPTEEWSMTDGGGGSLKEEWSSFFRGSSTAVLGAVTDLLSSSYGPN